MKNRMKSSLQNRWRGKRFEWWKWTTRYRFDMTNLCIIPTTVTINFSIIYLRPRLSNQEWCSFFLRLHSMNVCSHWSHLSPWLKNEMKLIDSIDILTVDNQNFNIIIKKKKIYIYIYIIRGTKIKLLSTLHVDPDSMEEYVRYHMYDPVHDWSWSISLLISSYVYTDRNELYPCKRK